MQLREIYDKYGSMGLELAEQIGAENVAMVMRFQTPGMAHIMWFLRSYDLIIRLLDISYFEMEFWKKKFLRNFKIL